MEEHNRLPIFENITDNDEINEESKEESKNNFLEIKINNDLDFNGERLTFYLSFNETNFNINYYFEKTEENRIKMIEYFNQIVNGEECKIFFTEHSIFSKGFIHVIPSQRRVAFKFDILVPNQEGQLANFCDMLLFVPIHISMPVFINILQKLYIN